MGCNYHETQSLWHEEQHQQLDFIVQQFDTSFRRLFPVSYWVRNVCDCVSQGGGVGACRETDTYNQAHCTYSLTCFVLKSWPVVWSVMPPSASIVEKRLPAVFLCSFRHWNIIAPLAHPRAKQPLLLISFYINTYFIGLAPRSWWKTWWNQLFLSSF